MANSRLFKRVVGATSKVDWPPAPEWVPVQASDLPTGHVDALPETSSINGDFHNRAFSIVIGMGKTGDVVLRLWHRQVVGLRSSVPFLTRDIIIAGENKPDECYDDIHWLAVDPLGSQRSVTRENRRREWQVGFQQSNVVREFEGWLMECSREFKRHRDAQILQVFVVSSLAEPAVGMIGEVLEVIRRRLDGGDLNLVVTTLLSTEAPDSIETLGGGERFAALREILRMAHGDFHYFSPLLSQGKRVLHIPMVDYVFLFGVQETVVDPRDKELFDLTVGQALAEMLYLLNASNADYIWQDLQNVRSAERIQTAGIATLYVPVTSIQEYVAVRLVDDALFGVSVRDNRSDGLFASDGDTSAQQISPSNLARHWLTDGPCPHPLFEWILTNERAIPSSFVDFSLDDFDLAFRSQIAHGLTALLNHPGYSDKCFLARETLEELRERLRLKLATSRGGANGTGQIENLLRGWQSVLSDLIAQMNTWRKRIGVAGQRGENRLLGGEASFAGRSVSSRASNPFADLLASLSGEQQRSAEIVTEVLQQWRRQAEEALTAACGGEVRRPLTFDDDGCLSEVERYYRDTIRPELTHQGDGVSVALRRVRERVAWWAKLDSKGELDIRLVCIPPEKSGDAGLASMSYTPGEIGQFMKNIRNVARRQASRISADLSGPWFWKRTEQLKSFLFRARTPHLVFQSGEPKQQYGYLFCPPSERAQQYRDEIFPVDVSARILDGEGGGRITALTIVADVVPEQVDEVRRAYRQYRHRKQFHIYPQEQLAAEYERRIRMALNVDIVFSPQIVATLSDPQLVTLFAQALFAGLLIVRRHEFGDSYWTILPVGEMGPLQLTRGRYDDFSSLWSAFREFTIFKPYRDGIEYEQNPQEHFAPAQRKGYLKALHHTIRRKRDQEGFPFCPEMLLEQITEQHTQGKSTALRAFAAMLAVELHEPMWKDW